MTTYSYAQLMGLWINAGGSAATAAIAAAVAEAESGGNPDDVNPNDSNGKGGTQSSYGLWQLSNGTHSPPISDWANPAANAAGAVAKWKAQGFKPWGSFTSGAYKGFLSNSTTPATNIPGNPNAATAQGSAASAADCFVPNPFQVSIPVVGTLSAGPVCLLTRAQVRAIFAVALIGSGVVLLGIGLYFVGVYSAPGRKLVNYVMSFVPGEGAGAAARNAAQAEDEDEKTLRRLGPGPEGESEDMEIRGGTVRESPGQVQARQRRQVSNQRRRELAAASDTPPF